MSNTKKPKAWIKFFFIALTIGLLLPPLRTLAIMYLGNEVPEPTIVASLWFFFLGLFCFLVCCLTTKKTPEYRNTEKGNFYRPVGTPPKNP